jgi:hypothetical protein
MAAAAATVSALRYERTLDWLEELERICERGDALPQAARLAIRDVVAALLTEATTTAGELERAQRLSAAISGETADAAAAMLAQLYQL